MERLIMLLVITVALSLAADQSSCSTTTFENSAHTCGYMSNGSSCGFCDVGRCCSRFGFCQRPADILSSCCGQNGGGQGTYSCNARCHVTDHSTEGVVNATLNGYLDGRRYVTDGGDVNTTSFSCVDSFDSDRKQYPSAAFIFVSSASNCGRCLKVTNVGIVGGVRREVTVRIVHERISSHLGIELDSNGFKQLDIDGNRKLKGQLMVKYEFLSC